MPESQRIITRLRNLRLPMGDEAQMQDALAVELTGLGIEARREYRFSDRDRVDFFTTEGLAIELKVDSTRNSVLRQLLRYAEHDSVTSLLLITRCSRHLGMPPTLLNKPLTVHQVIAL